MSKRQGEDLDSSDPQKKQKLGADLPTSSSSTSTGSKISYGSLKSQAATTSSSISYAALRKQQVSNMKVPPKLPTNPATQLNSSALSQANLASLNNATKSSLISSSNSAQVVKNNNSDSNNNVVQNDKITTSSEQPKDGSQIKDQKSDDQTNKSEKSKFSEVSNNPQSSLSQAAGAGVAPKVGVDLKSQQQQILERAKKLKEEEMKLRLLKKQEAVRKAMENTAKGIKPTTTATSSSSSSSTKTAQQLKEEQKAKEKKPLTKQDIEMQQLQKYAMKKELEKKRIEHLIKTGKIKPEDLEKQKPKEEIKIDSREIETRTDADGNIIDAKGNIIVTDKKKSSLAINEKDKQLKKLLQMKKNARFQNSQVFQDTNLFMTTGFKRDRKKIHALNFIEDLNEQKEDDENKMDIENSDNDISDSSGDDNDENKKNNKMEEEGEQVQKEIQNDDFKQMIQKTEVDYRREEFQKSNSRYLQSLLHKKKQSLKQKHHDPIPDIEWWDLPLFDTTRRYYLPLDSIANQQNNNDNVEENVNNTENNTVQTNENNLNINILDNLENIKQLLNRISTDDFNYSTNYYRNDKLTNLIEHPKPFKNEGLPNQNQVVIIPNYMTKQEQKKLRRRHRLEKEKEKQDKIKLGLIEPPPPKVKLKNMMRVLGNEHVADPTKMEALVRQGIADRLQEHLRRNEERKLTKEQKAEKLIRKLKRDSSIECRVCVFRIENLQDRVHKFKVDINAQQMQLHGLLINPIISQQSQRSLLNIPAIVVVEGGPKAIKFYKKLLLRRIKWNQNSYLPKDDSLRDSIPDLQNNKCALVWEGVVKDHSFNKWKVVDADSEVEAKRPFSEKNVDYYFDMAINYQYPQ